MKKWIFLLALCAAGQNTAVYGQTLTRQHPASGLEPAGKAGQYAARPESAR
ncbi:MAG: hypothetical protein IPM36_04420 [Lewinellaceae bacterium]|nr:hypothetical protein [Lewinellaceae bacterium]